MPSHAEQRLEQRRDGRLGHGAERQAGDGDAELAGREVQVELVLDLQRQPGEEAGLGLASPAATGRAPTAANSAATK